MQRRILPAWRYRNFAELARHEREFESWRRVVRMRGSDVAILAPHGGRIERGTTEIALAIAGTDLAVYCFEGLKSLGNGRLHIRSTRFDDPVCLDLLETTGIAVTIHGCRGARAAVHVGGLHDDLAAALLSTLRAAGFRALRDETRHAGRDPANLCNRGTSGRGVQLEISRGLRDELRGGAPASSLRAPASSLRAPAGRLAAFAAAVRRALPPSDAT